MTTKQLNKLNMFLTVEGICDDNDTAWQTLPAFADAYASLKTRMTGIQTFSQSQAQDNTGITQDKKNARQTMCAAALAIANAVHAFAMKNKNNQLAMQTNFSMSSLVGGRDIESALHCQNIHDIATADIASLADFGVTAAKLDTLAGTIAAFNAITGKPRDTRTTGKTLTGSLQAQFDAADEDLGIMDDLLGQIPDATFVSDYKNARVIVDTAASHTNPPPPPPPPAPPNT